jgi:hypothetical protein
MTKFQHQYLRYRALQKFCWLADYVGHDVERALMFALRKLSGLSGEAILTGRGMGGKYFHTHRPEGMGRLRYAICLKILFAIYPAFPTYWNAPPIGSRIELAAINLSKRLLGNRFSFNAKYTPRHLRTWVVKKPTVHKKA